MSAPKTGWRQRAAGLFLRGVCMGAADVIPGVSGGTVALITGIYDELVGAIAAIDTEVGRLLLGRRWRAGLRRANAGFLLPLLAGIGTAVLSLSRLITYLLAHHPQPVWGFFTGLILASAAFVGRQIGRWRWPHGLCLAAGAAAGLGSTMLVPMETGTELHKFFLAGAVAIVAMILPGISGSFMLVVLGKYQQVFAAIDALRLDVLAAFAAGCAAGLLAFSRLLKLLLARFHGPTMAALVGLMLGSMQKVWPFRQVLAQRLVAGKVVVLRDACVWPAVYSAEVVASLGLMLAGAVLVLVLERAGRQR